MVSTSKTSSGFIYLIFPADFLLTRQERRLYTSSYRAVVFLTSRGISMNRLSMLSGLVIVALALIVGSGATQDVKKDKDEKKEVKLKGMLPQGFKDLGLSKEQVLKIYMVQTEYNTKIAELNTKINELKSQRAKEEVKILTEEQREKYLKAKGLEPKDKAPKDKVIDKKPTDK
jgi:hypothetical protein